MRRASDTVAARIRGIKRGAATTAAIAAAGAAGLAGASSAAAADEVPSCEFDTATGELSFEATDPVRTWLNLKRNDDRIVAYSSFGTDNRPDCGPIAPTVNNVDLISVDMSASGDTQRLRIDFDEGPGSGPFEPGRTDEGDGSSEIEIEASFDPISATGDYRLELGFGDGDDRVQSGALDGRPAINLNAGDEDGGSDADVDVTVDEGSIAGPGNFVRIRGELRGGRDRYESSDDAPFNGLPEPVFGWRETWNGGTGEDRLTGNAGADDLRGDGNEDEIAGREGDDKLRGGNGLDEITASGGNNDVRGGQDDDVIRTGNGNDRIRAGGGADEIRAGGRRDRVDGQAGRDLVRSGGGNDIVFGGQADDVLKGGRGGDKIQGGNGDDQLRGGKDEDRLKGNRGRDEIRGGKGRDRLAGDKPVRGSKRDRLIGGQGIDRVIANDGRGGDRDLIIGRPGVRDNVKCDSSDRSRIGPRRFKGC